MLPLKETKTKAIVWGVIALMSIGAYVFSIMLISSTNKTLASIEHELDMELDKESALRDLGSLISETKNDRNLLASYSIDSDGVVSFINNIELYARESGNDVEIKSVDLVALDPASEFFETLEMTIVVKGKWVSVYRFAKMLDYLPVNTLVEEFSIDRNTRSEIIEWEGVFKLSTLKKK